MKMIIRADDVGYTHVHNLGTFDAVDKGVVTACDVMLDTPGTEEALKMLHERPWISTGWHTHFWGAPVLDPKEVPSMYDEKIGHFRRDLSRAQDVDYDECLKEMRAQMDRCVRILGRPLDIAMGTHGGSPFSAAMGEIIKEYGIPNNAVYGVNFPLMMEKNIVEYTMPPADEWKDRKIYMTVPARNETIHSVYRTDSIQVSRAYEPLNMWLKDEAGLSKLPEDATAVIVFHPGYLDYYVCREGSQTQQAWNFLTVRPLEVHALCSDTLRQWMKEHDTELVNFRDALYGTHDYQNHLRVTGSELYRGGVK